MISGRDENGISEIFKLAAEQCDRLTRHHVPVKEVAGDEDEVCGIHLRVSHHRRECRAKLVPTYLRLSLRQGRKRRIQMHVRSVQYFYHVGTVTPF